MNKSSIAALALGLSGLLAFACISTRNHAGSDKRPGGEAFENAAVDHDEDEEYGECKPRSAISCYRGPEKTAGVGSCRAGTMTCSEDGSGFGICDGEILPRTESCATAADENCDGQTPKCAVLGAGKASGAAIDAPLSMNLSIRPADGKETPPLPKNMDSAGPILAFLPHHVRLEQPVRIRVPFNGPASPSMVLITTDGKEPWTVVPGAVVVDGAMEAEVSHFSYFDVARGGCSAIDQCHAAGVFNPATGACSDPVLADGTACDDNMACTSNDSCQSGLCVATDYARCDVQWRNVPIESIPTPGTCSGTCVNALNADDNNYLQYIACTNGGNTSTEYNTPTDLRYWVSDYAGITDASVVFEVMGSGSDARASISCIDSAGTTLSTLVENQTFSTSPGLYVYDVPVACFVEPLVTLRVTRLGGNCLAADTVRLAVASDYRREPIQSIPTPGSCTNSCVTSLNTNDNSYLNWLACSNGANTSTEYTTPTDLRFTVADYASVTSAIVDFDMYGFGADARMTFTCVDGAGTTLAMLHDASITPISSTRQLYSFDVPTACFVSPAVTVRVTRVGSHCLGVDVASLAVKSSAHRVSIASISATGSCNSQGNACRDNMNNDDGNYLSWIACSAGANTSTEYNTPTDFRFTVLDRAQVTRAAIALDLTASGSDARMQISCVNAAGATLATILPTTLFPQVPRTYGYDVPLACLASSTVTIRITRIGGNCLGADYVRLYTTSPVPPFLIAHSDPIDGYTDRPSVAQGESIDFNIHTTRSLYSIDFMRLGETNTMMLSVFNLTGRSQPTRIDSYRHGAGWNTSYTLSVPANWPTGLYAARVMDTTHEAWISFVVKEAGPGTGARLALLASTNTWDAYNGWGGASFYGYSLSDITGRANRGTTHMVSMERPRATGYPFGDIGHTASGEMHLIRWLDQNQYPFSMLSDNDLHLNPGLLSNFDAVIISTHSEYWSAEMYDHLVDYLNSGGNLLYLSGNGIYWKVSTTDGQTENHKDNSSHAQTQERGGLWRDVGRPEAAVTGVRYTGEGYPFSAPFTIRTASHWTLEGTGLAVGDRVGKVGRNLFRYIDATGQHDINGGSASGWETDYIDPLHSPANIVLIARATSHDAAYNPAISGDITYYDHPGGGGVFSAGSINFGGSLIVDDHLGTMVSNVLRRFGVLPSTNALKQIVPINSIPTAGSCTADSCIPGMNHSNNSYLQWVACANGTNTPTEYTTPTDFRFQVPEYANILGATLTLDTYGSGSNAVESVTCVNGAGSTLATIQPALRFDVADPRAVADPAFSHIYRWPVPSACFVSPTLGIRIARTGANCLGVDYLGLSINAPQTPHPITSIPTAGSCTSACVTRLNADDNDYVQWLACANGTNTATEYTSPTDLRFTVPTFASVTGAVFLLDAYASGSDSRVQLSCVDAAGATLANISPTTLYPYTPQLYRYAVPTACFAASTVTIRMTRVGSNCLGVDYARLLTTP